jgi:hypothetical protein
LGDPRIASTAASLAELAIQGSRRLGASFLEPKDLEQATDLFERYTQRGLSPAS